MKMKNVKQHAEAAFLHYGGLNDGLYLSCPLMSRTLSQPDQHIPSKAPSESRSYFCFRSPPFTRGMILPSPFLPFSPVVSFLPPKTSSQTPGRAPLSMVPFPLRLANKSTVMTSVRRRLAEPETIAAKLVTIYKTGGGPPPSCHDFWNG